MNKFFGCVLICLLVGLSSVSPSQASEDALQNGAFVFRGRLIGVHFQRDNVNDTIYLTLQFLTEDSIADFAIRPAGTGIQNVATNIKLDPSTLTVANYRELIEASIGHGIRLGDSCLVVANRPGVRGKELLSIEPAKPEAEARLRAAHHESVVYFRRLNNRSEPSALDKRLGIYITEVNGLISQIESSSKAPADYHSGLKDAIKRYVGDFSSDYTMPKASLATRMSDLESAANATNDAGEKHTLRLMLCDLKEIDAKIEQKRAQMKQRLQDIGLEFLMPDELDERTPR